MSILIRNMEMPEKCTCCPLVHYYEDLETGSLDIWCKDTHELLAFNWEGTYIYRPDWCPISDVPTPHGRLIDADVLMEHIGRERLDSRERIVQMVNTLPTIVEAEE